MNYLIPALVGAVIGYFTNWLAIKMLFRPYYEKKIFGVKLPFTPGLIPKEQKRIAKNIGLTVSSHLLSTQVIMEKLEEKNIDGEIEKIIDEKLNEYKDSDKSLGSILNEYIRDYPLEREKILRSLNQLLKLELGKEENLEGISNYLYSELSKSENLQFIEEKLIEISGSLDLEDKVYKFVNSEADKLIASLLLDERPVKDLIGPNYDRIFKYIDENNRIISYKLKQFLKSPDINKKLKDLIEKIVEENVSRLVTSFISKETISRKIEDMIFNYLDGERFPNDLGEVIKLLLNKELDKPLQVLLKEYSSRIGNIDFAKFIANNIDLSDLDKNISRMLVEEIKSLKLESYYGIAEKVYIEIEKHEIILPILDKLLNLGENIKVGWLINHMETYRHVIKAKSVEGVNYLIENKLPILVEKFNIAKVVEDNINSFEMDFAEKIILDIAKKELNAITYLGGILGLILGLVSPLLQNLF